MFVRQINLRHENRRRAGGPDRLRGRELAGDAAPFSAIKTSVAKANSAFCRRRRKTSPRPIASSAPLRSKRSKWSRLRAAPVRLALRGAAQKQRKPADFLAVRRKKNPADLEEPHALRARANVAFQGGEQARHEAGPERDVIFAQRIAQLDRFPGKARA